MAELESLSPGEWSVLALLCEANAHGWPLVRTLAPEGEIGSIWTVRRAVVYRTLDVLLERKLIEAAGVEASARGPREPSCDRRAPAARPSGGGLPSPCGMCATSAR